MNTARNAMGLVAAMVVALTACGGDTGGGGEGGDGEGGSASVVVQTVDCVVGEGVSFATALYPGMTATEIGRRVSAFGWFGEQRTLDSLDVDGVAIAVTAGDGIARVNCYEGAHDIAVRVDFTLHP